ncbi:hypothetical protein MKW98_019731 [Papaver atlanticum]|uniref:Bulb-type lectin domain-containing protein n=1 Tax=Papaver atlanticum TaxID=357466 RepID=A0AAD4XWP4_9MAGN|nr:hypothetical protein MKW98_019731 [Papaver atlanticum]
MDSITNNSWVFLSVLVFGFVMCSKPYHTIAAGDTLSSGDSLTGDQTITSRGDIFVLGFFKPGNTSKNYYIGIWYKKVSLQTAVWVANRDAPITDPSSSKLTLSDGNLVLLSKENETPIWSTNLASNTLNTTQVVLGDDGNLVLRDSSNPHVLYWQSFEHLTDTFLPGAKFGFNKKTNQSKKLTSWRGQEDPSTGLYNLQPESTGKNQYILYGKNSKLIWDSGEWNEENKTFLNSPEMRQKEKGDKLEDRLACFDSGGNYHGRLSLHLRNKEK